MRPGLRESARRDLTPVTRRLALRPFPRGDGVPFLPRSALHDAMPGRLDSAQGEPRDHHRGLVHRLREMRGALPLRQHQHAPARSSEGSPDRGEIAEPEHSADGEDREEKIDHLQGEHLRSLHPALRPKLRLRLPARRREAGRSAAVFRRRPRNPEPDSQRRMDTRSSLRNAPHPLTWKSQTPSPKFQRSSKSQIPNGPAPHHCLGFAILSLEFPWDLGFGIWDFDPMRINNWKHFPWIVFVCLATIAACILYAANFHPDRLPPWIHLPASWIQKPTEHHTVGGTPLGLWFGSISLGILIFAELLRMRKKIPLWRVGTVQRWLRAHIWLTFLTIPLVILHSGFRLGGPMTTLLLALYALVMVSGIYGLILQHQMPHLMKERLPAETVFEQIPHIRSQLYMAAEKLRDSFRPMPPKKTDAGAPAPSPAKSVTAGSTPMSSTAGDLSTPTARAKSTVGSTITAEPISTSAATAAEATEVKATEIGPPVAGVAEPGAQTIPSLPATTGVQSAATSAATTVAKP